MDPTPPAWRRLFLGTVWFRKAAIVRGRMDGFWVSRRGAAGGGGFGAVRRVSLALISPGYGDGYRARWARGAGRRGMSWP